MSRRGCEARGVFSAAGAGRDVVLRRYRALMEQFLDVQQRVLSTCLNGAGAGIIATPSKVAEPPRLRQGHEHVATGDELDNLIPDCPRFAVEVAAAESAPGLLIPRLAGLLVIVADARGVAPCLAAQLASRGIEVAVVTSAGFSGPAAGVFAWDDVSADGARELVRRIHDRHGRIAGWVFLRALDRCEPLAELDHGGWRRRLAETSKSIFFLLQASAAQLIESAEHGGSLVLGATGMGGRLGIGADETRGTGCPGDGAVIGLLKTVAEEWPKVTVRGVDLDPQRTPDQLADDLVHEIGHPDRTVEVGRVGPLRYRVRLVCAAPPDVTNAAPVLDPSSVVLVTGGARGITAQVAIEIASRYQPRLILAGRSPLPPQHEPPEVRDLTEPREVKAALIEQMKATGRRLDLAQVEKAYQRLIMDRDMRANLASMRQAGGSVEYVQVDVHDETQFGALIDQVYERYGRLDGVIHGAGLIEDKLLADKTAASFDRVFDTKTGSALTLARKLDGDSLRFLVLFSSVAGRFGNRGQCDYTAANEVLNKMAAHLDARWQARVVAVDWGPWDKVGMVDPQVRRQFLERGVPLVDPIAGRRALANEIAGRGPGPAEIVIGDGPWAVHADREAAAGPGAMVNLDADGNAQVGRAHAARQSRAALEQRVDWPLLSGQTFVRRHDDAVLEIERRFDPTVDVFLQDHVLDGKPVLPAAMAAELMAEAAGMMRSDLPVAEVRDLRVLRGVVLEREGVAVRVQARRIDHRAEGTTALELRIVDADQPTLLLYLGTVTLGAQVAAPSVVPKIAGLEAFGKSWQESYTDWLFHGPRFQCIRGIGGISPLGMVATVRRSRPSDCVRGGGAGGWRIDPVVLDSGPQLAILWARHQFGKTALPTRFGAVRAFGPLPDVDITCHFVVRDVAGTDAVTADVFYTDRPGRVLLEVRGLESACSRALNRFTGRSGLVAVSGANG